MNIELEAKKFMKANGWTQEQLADAVGIHPITLCKLLKAPRRKLSAREKLETFLAAQLQPTPPDEARP